MKRAKKGIKAQRNKIPSPTREIDALIEDEGQSKNQKREEKEKKQGQGSQPSYLGPFWNLPAVSLVLPAFDEIGSPGFPPRQMFSPPGSMVPLWVTASRFLTGNRKAELKLTTLSSLLLFRIFPSFLFS